MDYAQALWLYLVLLFGIIVVPGMDMFFVLANALTRGRKAGFAAVAGIMLGGAIHTLFGALAVGVLTQLPTMLFQAMILVGAAYMAWIGYTLLRSTITVDSIGGATARSDRVIFRQGLVTCLLNPKAYLFVLAVFPQFMRPEYGPIWSQAVVMGLMTSLCNSSSMAGWPWPPARAAMRWSAILTSPSGLAAVPARCSSRRPCSPPGTD
jgi:threonine/homoserine/homoserine lactone efflux protein